MGQEGKEERIKSKEFIIIIIIFKVFKSLPTLSAQNCDSREIFLLQTDSETRRISSVVIN